MPNKTLIHQLSRPIAKVYPYFSNMELFVSVHPVLFKCDHLTANSYLLHEHFPTAAFGITFAYKVSIEDSIAGKQLTMFAEIRKGTTLRLVFDFEQMANTTKVTETITFNGPSFIKPIFIPFLFRTHLRLMHNINKYKKLD